MDFTPGNSGRTPSVHTTRSPEPLQAPQRATPEPPQPRAEHSPRAPHTERPRRRKLVPIGIAIAVLVVLLAGAWWWFAKGPGNPSGIDGSKYQAVFFTNGQVYFGKLHQFNGGYMRLTDIYYLQTPDSSSQADSKNPQQTTTNQSNVQLIKLGDEVHGPEDEMIISKDQVLFYENLKPSGKVSQTIQQAKKKSGF